MTCPGCKQHMIVLEIEGVEIDHCIACGGAWLDGGELELLLEAVDNREHPVATAAPAGAEKERPLRCPNCRRRMEKISYGNDKKVLLDRCRKGHGLWFDKGELGDVIRMGNFEAGNRVFRLLNDVFGK